MKSNHQVWPGSFLPLHQLLPELMVEAPVCADVHSVSRPKGPERRPHNGPVQHLWSHHDNLDPLVSRKHVVQLVVVCQFGSQRLAVACAHQVDGERLGVRFQTKQPHPPGYSQWPREELAADPPQRLPQVLVIRALSPRVGPQICHDFTIYNGIQVSWEISLESEEVVPAFDL